MFLVGSLDYDAGSDGQRLWFHLNGVYNLCPHSYFQDGFRGIFRGSIVNLPGTREDYLQAIGCCLNRCTAV